MLEMRKLYNWSVFLGYSDHSSSKWCWGIQIKFYKHRKENFVHIDNKTLSNSFHNSVSENQEHPTLTTTLSFTQFSASFLFSPWEDLSMWDLSVPQWHVTLLATIMEDHYLSLVYMQNSRGANLGTIVDHSGLWNAKHGMWYNPCPDLGHIWFSGSRLGLTLPEG